MCPAPAEIELVEKDEDVTTILVDDDKWDELASDTPYSRKPIMTLCFAMFANSVALTNVFPYAGFMILHYGLTDDETRVGFYAGYLMTSFMAGRLLSSFYCGALSDRIGRKAVIRIGLWSCLVFSIGFGFSPTFAIALSMRLCMGLFNGLTGVAKAAIPEIVPKGPEQQTAMGYVAGMWNAGMVVGPAAGGVLAERPVNSLFRRCPYALPNVFAAGLALCALFVIEAWLPGKSSYVRVADTDEDKDEEAPRRACARVPRSSWLPIGVYCFLSTFSIFYEDCYPLWLLTPRREGGMGMAVDEIGAVLSATAVFTVLYQFLIFPFISERMPSHVLFPTSAGISAVLMPVAVLIARMKPGAAATWAALIAHNIVYRCAVSNAYTACFCTINNSCATDARGAVNGFAMSVASLFKAVGPSLGASLYAYGLDRAPNGGVGVLAVFGGVGAALGVTALVACKYMGAEYDTPLD
jgi:MFS family permease